MVVKLGETNIIKGVEESLLGCREGDRVEAYMTSKLAYDDKAIGIVKKEASVLWVYTIEKLTR
jgi:FKBP-type peptidyl-prolyl cis-trans isomerase 2